MNRNRNIKLTLIISLLFVLLVLFLTYLRITGPTPESSAAELSAEELRELGAVVYEEPVNLQPFSLLDHHGQTFTEVDLKGAWTLIFFGFTSCPDICPLTLTELSQFYRDLSVGGSLAADTRIAMVSVDPLRDTTEKMAEYMGSFHEDFIGLNGPYEDIAALARQLYIAHTPPPAADIHAAHTAGTAESQPVQDYVIDHSGNVLIINPEGRYQGFFDAAIQDRELTTAYEAIRAAY